MKKIKFIPVLLAFIASTCFAQEALQDQTAVWDDFSKGLNLKLSSLSLPKSQATIAENVRYGTELKALSKRDEVFSYGSADAAEAITGSHRLYLKDGTKKLLVTHGDELEVGDDATGVFTNLLTFTSGDYRWKALTWNNIDIWCDGHNQPIKTNGTVATYLGSCGAADAESGAGPDGTYNYKISYYTTTYEVLFNQVSNNVTVSDNDINLTMIPIAPDTYGGEDVTGRKVYRSDDGGAGTYNLLSNGTIANNTATTLADSDTDAACDAGAAYPGGAATYTPPKGRFPVVHHNRLWFANDPSHPSRIYYSEDGTPDVFVTNSYFNIRPDDGDEITFAMNLLGVLTISKNNSIVKLYTHKGDNPSADWEITDPWGGSIGCDAPYSAVNSPLGIIFLDWSGLYKFNGQYSTLISDAVTPAIKDISETDFANCWGAFQKNIYYLAYTSEATGASTNNRVLLLDVLSNAYSIDILSINTFCTFSSGDDWDVLYAGSSTNGTIYAFAETVHGISHRRHSDFTGEWNNNTRYIPTKWGGDTDNATLEIARRTTIDDLTGTIDNLTGDINREGTTGHYESQVLTSGATTFDKLYWHETIPGAGGNVLFYLRSGASSAACQAAAWSGPYTNPSGSDISDVTANNFMQYNIRMTTSNIDYTPTVYSTEGYAVKIAYDVEGVTQETSVDLRWRGGWDDLGYLGRMKTLKYLEVYYYYTQNMPGTLNVKFENWKGDEDTFEINLLEESGHYEGAFTNQAFIGKLFRMDLTESSLNDLTIRKVIATFDVEPLEFIFGQ